jgi:hypothetical protein
MPTGGAAWPTLTRSAAALSSGQWAVTSAHQAQLVQQASSRQVAALVLTVSSGEQGGGGYATLASQAQARWTAADGKTITGEIPVPLDTTAGTTQQLWVTSDGQPTDAPLQDSQVTDSAYFAGTFSVIALAVLLTITGLVTRRTLDKRRMAVWDAEWRGAGPRWTTRA